MDGWMDGTDGRMDGCVGNDEARGKQNKILITIHHAND